MTGPRPRAIIYGLKICLRRRDQAISSSFQHVATAITAADDEVFRNELSIMSGSFGESAKEAERLQPAMRGIRGNRATLARMVLGAKLVERYSMGGVYLGLGYAVPVVLDTQERVMRRIVRGLYWHYFESPLADDSTSRLCLLTNENRVGNTD